MVNENINQLTSFSKPLLLSNELYRVSNSSNDFKFHCKQWVKWCMYSYAETLHCASSWKFDKAYRIMLHWFQVAFREAHYLAGEVVALAEKQNMDMPSLTLQQLKTIRYYDFITSSWAQSIQQLYICRFLKFTRNS